MRWCPLLCRSLGCPPSSGVDPVNLMLKARSWVSGRTSRWGIHMGQRRPERRWPRRQRPFWRHLSSPKNLVFGRRTWRTSPASLGSKSQPLSWRGKRPLLSGGCFDVSRTGDFVPASSFFDLPPNPHYLDGNRSRPKESSRPFCRLCSSGGTRVFANWCRNRAQYPGQCCCGQGRDGLL